LSTLPTDGSPIISLFLRVDKERIDEDYTIRLKNLLRDAEEGLKDRFDHEQVEAATADLARIREFFRDNGGRFGEGVAVFASGPLDLWRVYEVPSTIESQVVVDTRPYIAPLVTLLEQTDPFCVCIIARDTARIFYGQMDQFEEIDQIVDAEVPGQHEQGGWSQARYERHVEEHVQRHFKRVADELFQIFNDRPFRYLVLGGAEEVVGAFVEHLHPYVRERHVGTIRLLKETNVRDVCEQTHEIIGRWVRGEKERYIDVLRNEVLSHDRGVSGLPKTIEALNQGQVLTLVVDGSLHAPGAVCLNCEAVQPETGEHHAECVYCHGQLKKVDDVIPEIVTRAYQQGAQTVFLDAPELQEQLRDLGRIGALLRFRIPNPETTA
ncbi:MAG: peptide chain release factor 1, partial [Thermomicrobiaceae bacterium]|nr:peptide chain release factor 1 [Thermomicrobiaceae bacterium]